MWKEFGKENYPLITVLVSLFEIFSFLFLGIFGCHLNPLEINSYVYSVAVKLSSTIRLLAMILANS
jgi:hypothetical protein